MTWTRVITRRIQADRATVFNLLAEVELWPAILPHVRSARVLRRAGRRQLIVVWASWRGLPLGYTAIVTLEPAEARLTIRHVSPLTRGSVATWAIQPPTGPGSRADVVELSLRQHVVVPIPLVGRRLADGLVGGHIALDLGRAMLDRLKEVAEGGSLADRR